MGAGLNVISDRWRGALQRVFSGDEKSLQRVGISYKDVKLTAAQLDTLNDTPVELVAAPGAGKVLECLGLVASLDFVVTRAELGSGTLDARYENSSGGLAAQITNAFAEAAADGIFKAPPLAVVALVNKALVLHASADVTSGDSILYVRVYYRTIVVAEMLPSVP